MALLQLKGYRPHVNAINERLQGNAMVSQSSKHAAISGDGQHVASIDVAALAALKSKPDIYKRNHEWVVSYSSIIFL
ncbi:hypothetical protein HPP92_010117 [Vanilla planifolia]|uniref:Uncharacterized protein n=1 Tax=Vanilla planifolia TaxID=51239 RepID=A0A835UX87_VANPL|nr:hypothetical protein HPP92_010117 [Vanilla planifolia]